MYMRFGVALMWLVYVQLWLAIRPILPRASFSVNSLAGWPSVRDIFLLGGQNCWPEEPIPTALSELSRCRMGSDCPRHYGLGDRLGIGPTAAASDAGKCRCSASRLKATNSTLGEGGI